MTKITVAVTMRNGQIVITPPPGVELELSTDIRDTQGAPDGDRMVTVARAAEILGCSVKTVSRYCTAGLIPGAKLIGGSYLMPIAIVADMANTKIKPGRPRKKVGRER